MDEHTNKEISNVRGGRGTTGEPAEIRESIAEARKEAVRIDHDLAKLKNDKDALLFTIADLRVKEKQSVDLGLSKETDAIRKELSKALEKIDIINGVIHETNAPEDHKKIQKIVSDWYGGKRDWGNEKARFQKAEKALESSPSDRRAQGDANRARAEMQIANERLGDIAKQAKVALESTPMGTVESEGISFTHEQALAERKELEERHKLTQKETLPEFAVEEVAEVETPIVIQEHIDEIIEEVPIIFQNVEEKTPELKLLPDPETDDDLLPIVTEHTEKTVAVPQVSRPILSDYLKKIFAFFSNITSKLQIKPMDKATVAPDLVATNEETVSQVAQEGTREENISPDEFLEKPLFTEFEAVEQPSVEVAEEKPQIEEAPVAVALEVKPAEIAQEIIVQQDVLQEESTEATVEESAQPMPQEITPGNTTVVTQIETQAEEVLRSDMDEIFGEKKGPLGIFGHTNGVETRNWKDPQVGFAVKTVGDVLRANPSQPAIEGQESFGVENKDLVEKMKRYLTNVSQVSELSLETNDGALLADFVRRSAISKLSK